MNRIIVVFKCLPEIILEIKKKVKLIHFQKEYRKANTNNGTVAQNIFPLSKVTVGDYTYGGIHFVTFDNDDEHLYIGKCCSIAENVTFVGGGEHAYRKAFLYPLYTHVFKKQSLGPTPTKGPIVVEDDVWIGYGSVILSGCKIGKGSVIGAGSVVTKDIPPFSIYAGYKILKSRFSSQKLRDFLSENDIENFMDIDDESQRLVCELDLNEDNLDMFRKVLK